MDIGLRIKELREEKKLTQEELASRINVTKQMISHYENGTNIPRDGTLKKMLQIFGLTIEEFYSKSTPDLTNVLPDEKLKWIEERDRLNSKIEYLQEKIITLTEGQLEELNNAVSEIIRLNHEIDRLRKAMGE